MGLYAQGFPPGGGPLLYEAEGFPSVDGIILYREIPLFTQHTGEDLKQSLRAAQETKVTGGTHIYDPEGFRLIHNKLDKNQVALFSLMPSLIVHFNEMDRLPSSYEVTAFEATIDEVKLYNNSVRDAIVALGLEVKQAYDPLHGLVIDDSNFLMDVMNNPDILTQASNSVARINYFPAFGSNFPSIEELFE